MRFNCCTSSSVPSADGEPVQLPLHIHERLRHARINEIDHLHLRNDLPLIRRIGEVVARDLPELRLSSEQNSKNWGSEDISILMNRVQMHGGLATYMRVMTPMPSAQHTVSFDMDEKVIGRSVSVFCASVLDLMKGDTA